MINDHLLNIGTDTNPTPCLDQEHIYLSIYLSRFLLSFLYDYYEKKILLLVLLSKSIIIVCDHHLVVINLKKTDPSFASRLGDTRRSMGNINESGWKLRLGKENIVSCSGSPTVDGVKLIDVWKTRRRKSPIRYRQQLCSRASAMMT